VTLAAAPHAQDRGTLIGSVFYTTKNQANSLDTFFGAEAGQLGFFVNQVPSFYNPWGSCILI
jgi:L-asparaginase